MIFNEKFLKKHFAGHKTGDENPGEDALQVVDSKSFWKQETEPLDRAPPARVTMHSGKMVLETT